MKAVAYHIQIPGVLLQDPSLNLTDAAVLSYLRFRQGDNAAAWPSQAAIGHDLGLSRETVVRSVARLVKLGKIEKRAAHGGWWDHNVYTAKAQTALPAANSQELARQNATSRASKCNASRASKCHTITNNLKNQTTNKPVAVGSSLSPEEDKKLWAQAVSHSEHLAERSTTSAVNDDKTQEWFYELCKNYSRSAISAAITKYGEAAEGPGLIAHWLVRQWPTIEQEKAAARKRQQKQEERRRQAEKAEAEKAPPGTAAKYRQQLVDEGHIKFEQAAERVAAQQQQAKKKLKAKAEPIDESDPEVKRLRQAETNYKERTNISKSKKLAAAITG